MDMVRASLAFIDGLGGPEMVLIFVIVLVLFGGQKLPEFARGLGKSIREFKKAAAGVEEEFKRALEEDERKNVTPKLAAAPVEPSPVTDEYMDHDHSDSGGPEAGVHSPVTDGEVATETVPPSDDVPADVVAPAADGPLEPSQSDTGMPLEPKTPPPPATPPAAAPSPPAPPAKSSTPPPASRPPENPS
jgi:sec-independent protein translocase protein TatA